MLFVLLISFYLCYNIATFLFDWWRFVLGRSDRLFIFCASFDTCIIQKLGTNVY
nr:MAG TPA: hypothetical protein [Caudoviricetes sp.]